jgi:hypothetical protein
MAEARGIAKSTGKRRLLSKKVIVFFIVVLAVVLACAGVYFVFERPSYIALELPGQGTHSNWEDHIEQINYTSQGEARHYYIWQNLELFDAQSSEEVAGLLDDWLRNHGWSQSTADSFGDSISFNPCQPLSEDTTDSQCRYYTLDGLDPEMSALSIACSHQLAALYVEYSPIEKKTLAVVTTIRASAFALIRCMT